jgi:hypothetical protein
MAFVVSWVPPPPTLMKTLAALFGHRHALFNRFDWRGATPA